MTETNPIRQAAAIILPSLDPDQKFAAVVKGLAEDGFEHIVIVDDGSDAAHQERNQGFAELEGMQRLFACFENRQQSFRLATSLFGLLTHPGFVEKPDCSGGAVQPAVCDHQKNQCGDGTA